MRFGSVCSGIEAASVAWEPLGWKAAWFAEIEEFPSAVLAHHYPDVPNLGDMTAIADRVRTGEVEAPDVLVGGTPCQAFSIAGLRNSLDDARGQLSLEFVRLANEIDSARSVRGHASCAVLWENVPGVLSTKDNAFGCFLGALAGEDGPIVPPGKKWTNAGCVFGPQRTVAWRVTDAQYFGVAQRRRRVFVVASADPGFDPASVLFESEGVRRDTAPRREPGQDITHDLAPCLTSSGRGVERAGETRGQDPVVAVAGSLTTRCGEATQNEAESDMLICMAHGQGGAEISIDRSPTLTCNHEAPIACYSVALRGRDGGATAELGGDVAGCRRASSGGGDKPHVLAFGGQMSNPQVDVELSQTLQAKNPQAIAHAAREVAQCLTSNYGKQCDNSDTALGPNVAIQAMAVRRLAPVECERLQAFPDNYTQVSYRKKPAADGPRYKALGNSMCVSNMRHWGERIQAEASRSKKKEAA